MGRVRSEICGVCSNSCKNNNEAIECDHCVQWFHAECIKMPTQQYKALSSCLDMNIVGLKWLCKTCDEASSPGASKNLRSVVNTSQTNVSVGLDDAQVCPSGSYSSSAGCPGKISCNEESNPDEASSNYSQSEKSKKFSAPICSKYRRGKCERGDDCTFSHPPKCLKYCRYGREGCGNGFRNCSLLHPVLCRNSLRYRQCFNPSCTFTHLKGTARNPNNNYNHQPQYNRHNTPTDFQGRNGPPVFSTENPGERDWDGNQFSRNYSNQQQINSRQVPLDLPSKNNFLEMREIMRQLQNQINNIVSHLPNLSTILPNFMPVPPPMHQPQGVQAH